MTGKDLEKLHSKRAVVGFDGAVDTLVRVVKTAGTGETERDGSEYYPSLSGFGRELAEHQGKNCSFELKKIREHFGGNAPNVAHALSRLGVDVICIGTMGEPKLHPAFLEASCRKVSYGCPASTLALEFEDGKTFLEQNPDQPDAWEKIRQQLTREKGAAEELFRNADLTAMVNWSELSYAGKLWSEVFDCCFAESPADFSKYVFFDLCDISRRKEEECRKILKLMKLFSKMRRTVLGLNRNEAERIGKILGAGEDTEGICRKLQEEYEIGEIVVHSGKENFLFTAEGDIVKEPVTPVEHPAVLTGAGDHFSAAYCSALLLGAEPKDRLRFATEYAEEYVRTGKE